MEKRLGKIDSVSFGFNDYTFGLGLSFSGDCWGTFTFIDYNPHCADKEVEPYALKMLKNIQKLLKDAKVDSIDKLKNKPVEVIFEDGFLKEYRILTEVL